MDVFSGCSRRFLIFSLFFTITFFVVFFLVVINEARVTRSNLPVLTASLLNVAFCEILCGVCAENHTDNFERTIIKNDAIATTTTNCVRRKSEGTGEGGGGVLFFATNIY